MLEEEENKLAADIVLNSRCKVTFQNEPHRLGVVMYVGSVEGLSGKWVGVKYDEPLGKNDGSYVSHFSGEFSLKDFYF